MHQLDQESLRFVSGGDAEPTDVPEFAQRLSQKMEEPEFKFHSSYFGDIDLDEAN